MFVRIALIGSLTVNCMLLFYFFYDKDQSAQLNSQVSTSNTSSITSSWITCTKSDGSLERTSSIPDERYSSFEQYLNSPEASEKRCRMASEEEIYRKKERIKIEINSAEASKSVPLMPQNIYED
ncbi:MAG: hypothetical protein QNJ42_22050 [Crocosphaera sp.]|nr:hypothetical protein [Crocosphaera sp.]